MERLDGLLAVHPAWRPRLVELYRRTGVYSGSTWRSRDLQARWYWCMNNGCPKGNGCHGIPGNCPSANRPDESFHEHAEFVRGLNAVQVGAAASRVAEEGSQGLLVPAALAMDLGWDDEAHIRRAHAIAGELGLHFPIQSENWHVQPVEVPYTRAPSFRWTPFGPLGSYLARLVPRDPWAELFVPILSD